MNEKEKLGCREILENIQTEELRLLTDTVTKKLIKVSSRSEAISAILTYSQSSCELLKRKKIKRDLLFKYLVDKGIVVSVSSDKRTIIERLLKTWGTKNITALMTHYDEDMPSSSSSENFSEPQRNQVMIPQANKTELTTLPGSSNHSNACASASSNATDLQLLGETFARWFYKVLNSQNPHMGVSAEEFGPCHFWDEAKLMLLIVTDDQSTKDELSGSQFVSDRLLLFTKSEFLLFNPNISRDGVYVKSERHGMVVVLVCGTIHRQNQHLGVFDQMFGLVKDPRFNDNYKIKLTKLKLHNINVDHVPALKDRPESEIKDLIAV
ncbi:uncharacterized protein C3orf38 homolog [Mytilus californianus]|uniref:uncharacterized protein C3orf38 homolog n=1 Tax=Mytilus californianus TaxID=6549 RepID=UPI002245C554|nr:uncharacterized protein C3orf38 homolog [Mytilus californianus]